MKSWANTKREPHPMADYDGEQQGLLPGNNATLFTTEFTI